MSLTPVHDLLATLTETQKAYARSYAGADFAAYRKVEDELYAYYGRELPVEAFLREIADAVAVVPEAQRRNVFVNIEDYSEGSGPLRVIWRRDETDAEVMARIEQCRDYALECEAHDRAEYARLRAKFGVMED